MTNEKIKKILEIAVLTAKTMLESGAETYRVENTIDLICESRGLGNVESFVVPTGIFLSYVDKDNNFTYIKRIKRIALDLEVITRVNDFIRNFVASNMDLALAEAEILRIQNSPSFSKWTMNIFGGIASASFALLLGGNWIDGSFAFVVGFLVLVSMNFLSQYINSSFIRNVFGGFLNVALTATIVYIYSKYGVKQSFDKIIIGSIMPLVPGITITNALRDSISGHLISGTSKILEAIIIGTAIALGVGFGLQIYAWLGGL